MPRGNATHDTDTVSDLSEGEADSDDSRSPKPRKKIAKKEKPKAPRKPSPSKKSKAKEAASDDAGVERQDSDEDNQHDQLGEEYDEEDLVNIVVPDAPKPIMATNGGQRLMITDITVENFKSYYGTRRIGPFHHSFTSIIGPNGSGKSNVIDALLFVFGYKASKIRSKKVSVLIHSSAAVKEELNSCSVRISFQMITDNPDGTYNVVPNSSFNVSRTAYKNNTSEYRMNGTRMTIKEVAVKLREVGIDLVHNRFLILQGEVEQIAMMKPKAQNPNEEGMLEYLEDIIGSSRYKVPIEKLTAKLEKLQAEKSHQNARVNTAIRDKEALDEPVRTQLSYFMLENDHTALHARLNLNKMFRAEDAVTSLIPEQKRNEEELEVVGKAKAEIDKQMKARKKEIAKANEELENARALMKKTESEREVCMAQDKKREQDLNRLNNDLKKLTDHIKKEKQKLEEAIEAPNIAKAKITQLEIQLEELREELKSAQEMFDENYPKFTQKTEVERQRKAKLEEEYSEIAGTLAEADAKCKMAEASLHSMCEEYEKRKKLLAEVDKALTDNTEQLERKKGEAKTARENFLRYEEQTKTARKAMEELTDKINANNKRQAEIAPLFSEKQEEAKQRQVMGKISMVFEEAVKRGHMKGYHGRLGDLGAIDAKYDRAMSNNFNSVDNYIADNVDCANEGVALLKAQNMRTHFILLDKQQHLLGQIRKCEAEKGLNNPAPRLFNLIECEDKYKPAFFMVVRWTYVVENMNEAHKLFKQLTAQNRREQIVTLDGCMLTRRGAFIGGGQVKEGKMGGAKMVRRESSAKEDERMAIKIEEARKEDEMLKAEKADLLVRHRKQEQIVQGNAHPQKMENDKAASCEKQVKVLEERVRVQAQQKEEKKREMERAKVDEGELERKKGEIEELKTEKERIAAQSKTFKCKIKEVDNEMQKVYNKLVKPHEETREAASKALVDAESNISKQRAIINGADRNIAKQQTHVDDLTHDIDNKRGKANSLNGEQDKYVKRVIELKREIDAAEDLKNSSEQKIKEIREATSALDKEEAAIEKQNKKLLADGEAIDTRMKELQHAIAKYTGKMQEYQLHNVAELLDDIPQNMKLSSQGRLYLIDGESDGDLEDYDEFMQESPSKKKALKERKKSRREGAAKRRKMADMDDDEEEGETAEENGGDQPMEDAAAATAENTEEDEPMEVEGETDEQREARLSQKAKEKEERRQKEKEAEKENKKTNKELLRKGIMPNWSRENILRMDLDTAAIRLDDLEKEMDHMKKDLQPHVLEDYRRKLDKLRKESEALNEVAKKYADHRETLERLKKERLANFMGGFESISTALREMYQMITLGGDASLELKDLIDPFLEGVQFMVRPPKKSWKHIENLSGGEKTLSSLSLVFALHKYRPTPLYVMDEIDAALDFRNVSIIGHYIKDRTKNAQFIIISLRNNMFELADRLIGIYKVHDCTRNVVVDPKKVLEETKEVRSGLDKVRRLMESNKIQTGVGL